MNLHCTMYLIISIKSHLVDEAKAMQLDAYPSQIWEVQWWLMNHVWKHSHWMTTADDNARVRHLATAMDETVAVSASPLGPQDLARPFACVSDEESHASPGATMVAVPNSAGKRCRVSGIAT